jgi:hypothetical protein
MEPQIPRISQAGAVSTGTKPGTVCCRYVRDMIDPMPIRIIRHEAVPQCGSFEVQFDDGRPSRCFYWDDIPGRRLRPETVDQATAKARAQVFARAEQAKPA